MFLLLFAFISITGAVVFRYSKTAGGILLSAPLIALAGWWLLTSNHYFVPSTNLQQESLGRLHLYEKVSQGQLNELGSFEQREQENGFTYQTRGYFHLSTNHDHMVLSLSSGDSDSATSSGFKNGDDLAEAKSPYGDHYYAYREMGLGEATVYVDRENEISLTLWSQDDETISGI